MKVTRIIHSFVMDEITKRLKTKYADEITAEEERDNYYYSIQEACEQAAIDAYFAKAEELVKDPARVVNKAEWEAVHRDHQRFYDIIDLPNTPSVQAKISKERETLCRSIEANLELGCGRETLVTMLNAIN